MSSICYCAPLWHCIPMARPRAQCSFVALNHLLGGGIVSFYFLHHSRVSYRKRSSLLFLILYQSLVLEKQLHCSSSSASCKKQPSLFSQLCTTYLQRASSPLFFIFFIKYSTILYFPPHCLHTLKNYSGLLSTHCQNSITCIVHL